MNDLKPITAVVSFIPNHGLIIGCQRNFAPYGMMNHLIQFWGLQNLNQSSDLAHRLTILDRILENHAQGVDLIHLRSLVLTTGDLYFDRNQIRRPHAAATSENTIYAARFWYTCTHIPVGRC